MSQMTDKYYDVELWVIGVAFWHFLCQLREVVLVAGAQKDSINVLAGTIFEMSSVSVNMGQQWHLFPIVGPIESHGH
jgi:hypothetical protein